MSFITGNGCIRPWDISLQQNTYAIITNRGLWLLKVFIFPLQLHGNMASLAVSAYQTDAIDGAGAVSATMEVNSPDQYAIVPVLAAANGAASLGITSVHAENTGALSNGSAASCIGSAMVSAINAPSVVGIGGDFISRNNQTTTNPAP